MLINSNHYPKQKYKEVVRQETRYVWYITSKHTAFRGESFRHGLSWQIDHLCDLSFTAASVMAEYIKPKSESGDEHYGRVNPVENEFANDRQRIPPTPRPVSSTPYVPSSGQSQEYSVQSAYVSDQNRDTHLAPHTR